MTTKIHLIFSKIYLDFYGSIGNDARSSPGMNPESPKFGIVKFTKVNRRVYSFVKEPQNINLEPQQRLILNLIHQLYPVNRFELLHHMSRRMETKRDVSEVLAAHQKILLAAGCIRIEEYGDWRERLEREKEERMNAMIVPNGMGHFAIKVGDSAPVGSFPTVEDARRTLRRSCLDEQQPTAEQVGAIAQGTV
jgi:hypothetical protein